MKPITFMGNALDAIRDFPPLVKREVGYQLDRVQRGFEPTDWKSIQAIDAGVSEIRIQHEGQYRVIYIAKFESAVYVLHAFNKKTQKTSKRDIDAVKRALKILKEMQS
jgi:phage-related protein